MASQGEGSRSHHRRRPLRPVRTRSLSPPLTAGSASQPVSPRLIRLYPKPQLTLDVRPRARPRARPSRDPNPNVTFNTRMVLTPPISQPRPLQARGPNSRANPRAPRAPHPSSGHHATARTFHPHGPLDQRTKARAVPTRSRAIRSSAERYTKSRGRLSTNEHTNKRRMPLAIRIRYPT